MLLLKRMDIPAKEQSTGVSKAQVPTVGTLNKESGVRANVEASEVQPVVGPEVSDFVKPAEQQVPHEPQAGITASLESSPVSTQPTVNIQLPYSPEQAEQVLKEAKHSIDVSEHLGDNSGNYATEGKFFIAEEVLKFAKRIKNGFSVLIRKPV